MTDKLNETTAKLLTTDYPQWRNLLSSVVLAILCTGTVSSWWYAYYTTPGSDCHKGFLYLSVLWLAVQFVVISYLYRTTTIPAFARSAIKLLIMLANIWFGLFIFSLKPCAL